ncbi:enterobactin ABC transporter permease [Oceanicola sp. 22II-s10i]|nr:enterobactin ABC transporter permease [Oceanicola sp. 22II-s10i]
MAALLAVCAAGYMLWSAKAPWSFLLPYRATKLAALLLVGVALSVATVLFQTVTANRILTPSLMGFDALYVFVLTLLVHMLGATGYAAIPPGLLFAANLGAMAGLGLLLFAGLMRLAGGDMIRLVLSGIVLGLLIRSMTEFLQRLIDPSEFQTVQSMSFARFTQIDPLLLALSATAILAALAAAWSLRTRLDVLSLGDTAATGLGEPPARLRRQALVVICILVAAATALVGPLSSGGFGPSSFFGLIVTAFAHIVTPTHRHAVLIPSAALVGGLVLVGGQFIMERLFALATPLTVVIELIGGAVFLVLLLKRRAA